MTKRIYTSSDTYAPGFPQSDSKGWYIVVSDADFGELVKRGLLYQNNGLLYANDKLPVKNVEENSDVAARPPIQGHAQHATQIQGNAQYYYNPNQNYQVSTAEDEGTGVFDNPGKKIKTVATLLFTFGIIASFICGIVMGIAGGELSYSSDFSFGTALVVWIAGGLGSYLVCLGLAAIGDIAENVREINRKLK